MRHLSLLLLFTAFPAPRMAAQGAPTSTYWVYVANESSDLVSRVRFGPRGLVEEATVPVGVFPADVDGAHGISVSPDGRYWYVSIAHGQPYGTVWQFETGSDRLVDTVGARMFPATMGVTPDGRTLLVSNFNLHGDMVTSSVTAVFTDPLQEITTIPTCVMPHGGRVSPDGAAHYSVCMMDDRLIEISTDRLEVVRTLDLGGGQARGEMRHAPVCKPTWTAPSPDGRHVYVPCNGAAEVLEIDRAAWAITRRFATGRGPYNAEVSPDGRWLVVTLKGEQAVAVFDLATGVERRVETSQPITHGVVVSPDSRYAFVTNESVGAIPGTLDVIALDVAERVASVALQLQPGGIGFWKQEGR